MKALNDAIEKGSISKHNFKKNVKMLRSGALKGEFGYKLFIDCLKHGFSTDIAKFFKKSGVLNLPSEIRMRYLHPFLAAI
jgi:hypothetical protein